MPEAPVLKLFDVDQGLLAERDVAFVLELCEDLEEEPEMVRMFQCTVAFRFEVPPDRAAEPWDDASVRNWGRTAYEHVPHLLYYMDPDPGLGALYLAMSARANESEGFKLERVAEHPLVAAAHFARRMADPWEPIVYRFLHPLDPALATDTVEGIAAALALGDEER